MSNPLDEDISTKLNLGPDFQKAQCLLNSEVAILLDAARGVDDELSDTFTKTLDYVNKFSRFKNKSAVEEVRKLLSKHDNLEDFQIAALANLCPDDPAEAKTLLPSLEIDDVTLEQLLSDLKSYTV